MKKLLLLMFLVPVIQAQSSESKVCNINASTSSTTRHVLACQKGDVAVIKSLNFLDNVRVASKICELDSIKFTGGDMKGTYKLWTICVYTGEIREDRYSE